MKQSLIVLLGGILILAACAQAPAGNMPDETAIPMSATQKPTGTRSPTSTRMKTSTPTITPTKSVTPLPTIPSFTPTFDVSTIVTATPAPKAECPQVNPDLTSDLNTLFNEDVSMRLMDQPILDFLNGGGSPQKLITAFRQKYHWLGSNAAIQRDMTGDGVTELILTDGYIVYVFGCKEKKYQTLLKDSDDLAWMNNIQFEILGDMNLNGILEIIDVEVGGHTFVGVRASIFEWNGEKFIALLQGEKIDNNKYRTDILSKTPAQIIVRDTNGDGTLELLLESKLRNPVQAIYTYLMPWRNETDIYTWNGAHFTLSGIEYTAPEFRFQAIQDADRQVNYGKFDKALLLYQDTIFNDKLRAFSEEVLLNDGTRSVAIDNHGQPTPTYVAPDPSEYPHLAAYAYYRIMLLFFVQGYESDAAIIYHTLQEKFDSDPNGSAYVEMATAFWDAYQPTHEMYAGCAAAIQYAAKHPEILIPLGSDYHGSQSHLYIPPDVCPFR